MKSFFRSLNYSASNEDGNSEIKALQIRNTDTVLCITGSGSRTLDLLTQKPTRIVSLDCTPCQNFLLELKLAAIKSLEYEEFLEFLGVQPSQRRKAVYGNLRSSLSLEARGFWDRNISIIDKGVIYQGRWERYFGTLALLMNLQRPKLRNRLFVCSNLNEQTLLWQREWRTAFWRSFLALISHRLVWQYVFRDPAFFLYVPRNLSIRQYIENRLSSAIENILLGESSFAKLLFLGRYDLDNGLPIHLRKCNYHTLREQCENVRIITQSLRQYLTDVRGQRFDTYSLSDFSSYTSEREYEMIWHGILQTASQEARICERQFMVKRDLPQEIKSCVIRNTRLENELALTDTSIFYSFVVATVFENNHD